MRQNKKGGGARRDRNNRLHVKGPVIPRRAALEPALPITEEGEFPLGGSEEQNDRRLETDGNAGQFERKTACHLFKE